MKILVLGGGSSPEREISRQSAAAVREALEQLGHDVEYFDPDDGLDVLGEMAPQYDLVMPILHGRGGEDGSIQKILDDAGVSYLGAGAQASALCFDKERLKQLLFENGILTPSGEVVTTEGFEQSKLIRSPFVLKPVADGSSMGMLVARTLPYDKRRAEELLRTHGEMLLEELIEGIEITVPVLGNKALPVIEIVPPAGGEFDYENKYNGATAELCPPLHISEELQAQAQMLAETVHRLAGVRHLSRTDMIVTPEGNIYVLETNTLPGMTAQSLFPKGAAAAGLDWPRLVGRLTELASGAK